MPSHAPAQTRREPAADEYTRRMTGVKLNDISKRLFAAVSFCILAACSPALTPTPTLTPSPPPATISPALIEAAAEFCPMPRGWVIYLTQPGDSLASLAQRTSSSVDELATANCLNNPRGLDSGQVFYLPRSPISR